MKAVSEEYITRLRYEQNILKAETSFHEFIKQAWHVIEGNLPFVDGWHIQALCEHLEAVYTRQIKKLLINLPPRCCKSTIVSVAFPAWVWLQNPSERFLYASYGLKLALKDSVNCRRLMLSPWYQERWGHVFQLRRDQNSKGRFDNTQQGYRIATSAGSTTTGEGGSIIALDDPNSALDGLSRAHRERKIEWLTQSWSTRLNDRQNDCQILNQQRLHEEDASGWTISHDFLNEWVKLILPMEFELNRRCKTIILPSSHGKIWKDPRVKEGEILWRNITEKSLASLKQSLGSEYAIAGQLQQRPSPAEGGIIKKAYFQWWKEATPPKIEFVMQSWDTALTKGKKELNAYSVATTWGLFYDHNDIMNIILLSMWRDRVEYPELRKRVKRLFYDYRDTGKDTPPHFTGRPLDMCLIEAKASGDPLIHDLLAAGVKATPFVPNSSGGDKVGRVRRITGLLESGIVWLPARGPKFDTLLPFADQFLENVATFPNAAACDIVDTMSQAFIKLKAMELIEHPGDPREPQESYKETKLY